MADHPYQDANGRLKPGNPGKPKGAKDRAPRAVVPRPQSRLRVQFAKESTVALQFAGEKYLQGALDCLGKSARDNPQDAERLIKIVAPIMPKHHIEGAAHIADLPIESRLDAVVALMSRGEIDVASATALTNTIRYQIELAFVRPLKVALKDLEAALKVGDRKSAQDALFKLARELNISHNGAVEGEVVNE